MPPMRACSETFYLQSSKRISTLPTHWPVSQASEAFATRLLASNKSKVLSRSGRRSGLKVDHLERSPLIVNRGKPLGWRFGVPSHPFIQLPKTTRPSVAAKNRPPTDEFSPGCRNRAHQAWEVAGAKNIQIDGFDGCLADVGLWQQRDLQCQPLF